MGRPPPHRRTPHPGVRARPHPGSSVLRLASGSDRAVFVGDLLHSPVQILHPRATAAPAWPGAGGHQPQADPPTCRGRSGVARPGALQRRGRGGGPAGGRGFALGPWATMGP
ncbi:hypothetical protein NKH77_47005 [Streptomyces sp. M19]